MDQRRRYVSLPTKENGDVEKNGNGNWNESKSSNSSPLRPSGRCHGKAVLTRPSVTYHRSKASYTGWSKRWNCGYSPMHTCSQYYVRSTYIDGDVWCITHMQGINLPMTRVNASKSWICVSSRRVLHRVPLSTIPRTSTCRAILRAHTPSVHILLKLDGNIPNPDINQPCVAGERGPSLLWHPGSHNLVWGIPTPQLNPLFQGDR